MIRIRPDPGEIEPAIAEGQRRPVGTRLVQRDLVTEPLEVGGRDNVDVMRGIGAGPGEEDAPVTGGEARPIDARFVQDHLATERVAVGRGCHVQMVGGVRPRSEEHTSELQSRVELVCRLLPERTKNLSLYAESLFDSTSPTLASFPATSAAILPDPMLV